MVSRQRRPQAGPPARDGGPFSGKDRERCGFIDNEFVVACRYCDTLHRVPAQMTRESLDAIAEHFDKSPDCHGCYRVLRDVEWRKLHPRFSELEAMEKAARWMTSDKGGKSPTCQDLWRWLERNPVPIDPDLDRDEGGYP